MRVAIDARLAGPGLGIGQFTMHLASALAARGDIEVIWLGSVQADLHVARAVPAFSWLPYAVLDSAATASIVRRLGADVMHFAGNTGWRRRTAMPTVLTVHDLIFMRSAGGSLRQRLGHRYERNAVPRAVRAATTVVAVSEATAEDVRAAGWRADVHVIHHGATASCPSSPTPHARRAPYLVAFAGRDPRKGTDITLMAFRLLRGRVERLHLLASAGLPEGFVHNAADLIGTGEVVIHPRLPRAEVDTLIRGASALVYPSRDEGFGLPVLDGMRLGVPVVTGLCPATLEVGGEAIVAIDPARPARSIADAVERLLADEDLVAELKVKGSRRAATFSWDRAASQYVEAYREIAS